MAAGHLRTAPPVSLSRVVNLDVSSVPASSVQEESFTVNGLRKDQAILVIKPTRDAGLYLIESRVSAKDTLALTFYNPTGAAINPAAQDFHLIQF